MGMWCQCDVVGYGDRKAIAKFFSLEENDIHYIDHFKFSFGQKNVPGLNLNKLTNNNPDLIFLVNVGTDYDDTFYLCQGEKTVFVTSFQYEFKASKKNKAFLNKNPDDERYPWSSYFLNRDLKEIMSDTSGKYTEIVSSIDEDDDPFGEKFPFQIE